MSAGQALRGCCATHCHPRNNPDCLSTIRYWFNQTFVMPVKMPLYALWKWWPARYSFLVCFLFYVALASGLPRITIRQTIYDLNESVNFKLLLWHVLTVMACVFISFVCLEWFCDSNANPDHPGNRSAALDKVSAYNGDGTTIDLGTVPPAEDGDVIQMEEPCRNGGSSSD